MSRYIDADALKAKKTYSHERHEYVVPVAEIDWMPTVDAVQVVRCQKCKYYCGEETYTNHRICKIWNEETFANGWCYMEERRTE